MYIFSYLLFRVYELKRLHEAFLQILLYVVFTLRTIRLCPAWKAFKKIYFQYCLRDLLSVFRPFSLEEVTCRKQLGCLFILYKKIKVVNIVSLKMHKTCFFI